MTAADAPREVQEQRYTEWHAPAEEQHEVWVEPKPFAFEMPDEPAELTAQANAIRELREHQDAKCIRCGCRRAAHFKTSGHIVGIDHGFVEAEVAS